MSPKTLPTSERFEESKAVPDLKVPEMSSSFKKKKETPVNYISNEVNQREKEK
jgi:hypothetical protein